MNADEARQTVVEVLGQIAPEAELDDVDPAEDLRTEIDLDSMDFLGVIEALKDRTGVDVPEDDYPKVRSLDGVIAYLVAHTG